MSTPKAGWADSGGVLNAIGTYLQPRPFRCCSPAWQLSVGAQRELCWEQRPRGQSLHLPVKVGDRRGAARSGARRGVLMGSESCLPKTRAPITAVLPGEVIFILG